MLQAKVAHALEADNPPACMAYVPEWPMLLVVGTYTLHVDEGRINRTGTVMQSRSGAIVLYLVPPDQYSLFRRLHSVQFQDSAILDLKISRYQHHVVATAHSNGSISMTDLSTDGGCENASLTQVKTHQLFHSDILILSLSFHPIEASLIGVSCSNGHVAIVSISASNTGIIWEAPTHSLEAWTVAFDDSGRILYSGGDDNAVVALDANQRNTAAAIWKNSKTHGAGVTAVLPGALLPDTCLGEYILTGSYDECVRTFDLRSTTYPLQELRLGGGVWRLEPMPKYISTEETRTISELDAGVLASCMHAGPRILGMGDSGSLKTVAGLTDAHKSMNYASAISKEDSGWRRIVSSSFYDKSLCSWTNVQLWKTDD